MISQLPFFSVKFLKHIKLTNLFFENPRYHWGWFSCNIDIDKSCVANLEDKVLQVGAINSWLH